MDVRILKEAEIRRLVSPAQALPAVREAFVKLARGQATLPGVIGLDIPEQQGEVHVKGAYLHGSPFYSIKEAAGFYGNAHKGLPVGSGLVLVFDATTGLLRMILFDNGYLTELRTGAAGARGRGSDREITLADLTGVGIQDAAMADLVAATALAAGLGESITV